MTRHRRTLGFDSLERLTLLSSIQPAIEHLAPAAHAQTTKLPPFVRASKRQAERVGSDVHVQTIVVPGSFTEYEIVFHVKRTIYSVDITIQYPETPGPQPG
jgi:hypothetical protein